jgi:serine phosphatase RsbU (regulator of sigma subunit)
MEIIIAVEKVNKYATSDSGDTAEVIERPAGGLSVVLADGQSSGRGAKRISNMVVRKVISLLAEGVRDGAAARAASDYLFTERHGKVSATLNILSIDMRTRSLVITRNNPAPALVARAGQIDVYGEDTRPVGLYPDTRPSIVEIPLQADLTALVYTDGLTHAGERAGSPMRVEQVFRELLLQPDLPPQLIADSLLRQAVKLDQGRPVDDISVAVIGVRRLGADDQARRMVVRIPL